MTCVFLLHCILDQEYSAKKNVTPVKRARASSLIKGRVSGAGEF